MVVIPHPLGGLTQEQVYRKAEAALPEILKKAARQTDRDEKADPQKSSVNAKGGMKT